MRHIFLLLMACTHKPMHSEPISGKAQAPVGIHLVDSRLTVTFHSDVTDARVHVTGGDAAEIHGAFAAGESATVPVVIGDHAVNVFVSGSFSGVHRSRVVTFEMKKRELSVQKTQSKREQPIQIMRATVR